MSKAERGRRGKRGKATENRYGTTQIGPAFIPLDDLSKLRRNGGKEERNTRLSAVDTQRTGGPERDRKEDTINKIRIRTQGSLRSMGRYATLRVTY